METRWRAGLTVLGVVIGIAAVTTMVSVGQSASALVQSQFEALGTNVIIVLLKSLLGIVSNRPRLTPASADSCASVGS